jgi:signal transduction histidine kinase
MRWVWLILAAAFVFFLARSSPSFFGLIVAIGIGMFLNLLYSGLLWSNFFPNWLAVIAAMFDAILAVILLIIGGEWVGILVLLMVLPVAMAGARWGIEAGVVMALPIIGGYLMALLPAIRSEGLSLRSIPVLLDIAAHALALFAAGLVPGLFIPEHIKVAERENRSELGRLRVANERANLISKMAMTVSSTLDYRKVLRAVVDLAFSAMAEVGTKDESMVGMILLFEDDDDTGRLTVATGRNIARTDEGRKISAAVEGIIGKTIASADVIITHNAQNDPVLASFASTRNCRAAICAPLRAGLDTYGVFLFCSTKPDFYTEEHEVLLKTFSSQAIIPLQNAQLFEDLRHEQQRILEKEAEARRKLARDLHDGPTQSIAAMVMRLNFIKMVLQNNEFEKAYDEVAKVEGIAQRTTHEIRTMLFAMRPVILETQGLVPALQQYVDRLNQTENFKVSLKNNGYDNQLNTEAEGVVFAIIEEAVGNAKKHAQASQVQISLNVKNKALLAEIRDNGVGFDLVTLQSTYDQRTSLGLINMDERAQLVGGECTIESIPGRGTVVRLQIPFAQPVEV